MPAFDRSHYGGSYQLRAHRVVLAAKCDPNAICWRCGLTLDQARAMEPGRRITWQAGHTVDGNSSYPLAAEHSTCNQRAGQARGESMRSKVSRRWR